MSISQITSYSASGVSATHVTPVKSIYQTKKTTARSTPTAYSVELSHLAQAKSLKLSGYPVFLISLKLGLDVNTVNEYLGITDTAKSMYVSPKPAYRNQDQLTQDLYQLTFAHLHGQR